MRRVLILGSAGAGKSTLAKELGARLGLPVIHLDACFWKPGWRESPRAEWKQRVAALLARDAWIMDGTYAGTLPERLAAADTVILLDIPRLRCLYRVLVRGVRHGGETRDDLAPECLEQIPDWAFLRWIWSYRRRELPPILRQLTHAGTTAVVVLRSSGEIQRYVRTVSTAALRPAGCRP